MKRSEIFQKVLTIVSEHTEISEERILSIGRKNEEVDARSIAIHYWKQYGLDTLYIMQKMNRKYHNSVMHLYNMYEIRRSTNRYFRTTSSIIGQEIAKNMGAFQK